MQFVAGRAEAIDTERNIVTYTEPNGTSREIGYRRLVLATGSSVRKLDVPGLAEHAFDNDQLSHAEKLERHLRELAHQPDTPARNTVVIAGGGFTGIETAAEMPDRLRAILGADTDVKVIVVERSDAIGPDLGPGPRPVIEEALGELGVAIKVGTAVTAIDGDGAALADGTRIDSNTVIWTAGLEASKLTAEISGERDGLGRLHVTKELRVIGADAVFATGDVAFAATDDDGHHALMSCQHAMTLGRVAGHNAAADLLGTATVPYRQPRYVTCLDLGPWGAVLTEGWDRQVKLTGAEAKAVKRQINTQAIYPPHANRREALAAADPARSQVA